jgi:hypothetical protein
VRHKLPEGDRRFLAYHGGESALDGYGDAKMRDFLEYLALGRNILTI